MPAKSKQIIKHRYRDKDMESIIEIEEMEMKIEKLKDKTKAYQEEEEDDKTRCWGPCPKDALEEQDVKKDELEELEIT
jgi:hypothetical protein